MFLSIHSYGSDTISRDPVYLTHITVEGCTNDTMSKDVWKARLMITSEETWNAKILLMSEYAWKARVMLMSKDVR
jgi:hypothetical protein